MIVQTSFGPVQQFTVKLPHTNNPNRASLDVSCYYVDGLLVDSGPYRGLEDIKTCFQDLSVHFLVNSHSHEDHIGNNFWFVKNKECGPVLVHKTAVPIIKQLPDIYKPVPGYRITSWGTPPKTEAVAIGKEIQTDHYCFTVIDTPGHTPDHICLMENKQGWLFSGDLFIGEKVKTMLNTEDTNKLLHSLNRVLKCDFEVLFCGAGRVIEKDAKQAIRQKIEFMEEVKREVYSLYEKGWPVEQIRDQVVGQEDLRFVYSHGEYAKINFINAILHDISQAS